MFCSTETTAFVLLLLRDVVAHTAGQVVVVLLVPPGKLDNAAL
jgi:hypothetical protein